MRAAFAGAYWTHTLPDGRLMDKFGHGTHGIDVVLAALLGTALPSRIDEGPKRRLGSADCAHDVLGGAVDALLWEAAGLIGTGRLPFLLAAPTWHTGAIAPLVLVERLRAYRDAGWEPAQLVVQARRLRKALQHGADQPLTQLAKISH